MANVNVGAIGANAGVTTVFDELHHRIHVVEQAQAERLQFKGNVDVPFAGVIAHCRQVPMAQSHCADAGITSRCQM